MKCSPLGSVNSLAFFWSSWNSCADTSRTAERSREQRCRPRTFNNSFGQRKDPSALKRIASRWGRGTQTGGAARSEEHTSELQSLRHLVCRLLLEKKKKKTRLIHRTRRTTRIPLNSSRGFDT